MNCQVPITAGVWIFAAVLAAARQAECFLAPWVGTCDLLKGIHSLTRNEKHLLQESPKSCGVTTLVLGQHRLLGVKSEGQVLAVSGTRASSLCYPYRPVQVQLAQVEKHHNPTAKGSYLI